jgi:hypothetical protein
MFEQHVAEAALGRLAGAVDELLALSLPLASDEFVLAALGAVQVQVNRLAALDAGLVGEADTRRLHFERACANTAVLLSQLLRIEPAQAKARVRAAQELAPRRSLAGETLSPVYPTVAAALRQGTITARHAAVITRTVDALPAAVAAEHDRAVEQLLTEQAAQYNPATLATLARRVSDTLDPDGTLSEQADQHRRRYLDIHPRPDGSASVRAELDPICTEALRTVLDPLARPTPATTHTDTTADTGAEANEVDGGAGVLVRDPRSPGQRRHDGLRDALLGAIRAGQLPDSGGITTTILLTTTTEDLTTGTGLARTGHGALIPTRTVRQDLLPDAQLLPITLTRSREGPRIDSYGTARRLFTASQRLAMAARDGGCSFPGCTVPPAWCQAHHVTAWAHGGPTTLDNGTLLCGYHHRHHHTLGWTCTMPNGTPHWTPPAWLDPHQQPIRNTVHDPTTAAADRGQHGVGPGVTDSPSAETG